MIPGGHCFRSVVSRQLLVNTPAPAVPSDMEPENPRKSKNNCFYNDLHSVCGPVPLLPRHETLFPRYNVHAWPRVQNVLYPTSPPRASRPPSTNRRLAAYSRRTTDRTEQPDCHRGSTCHAPGIRASRHGIRILRHRGARKPDEGSPIPCGDRRNRRRRFRRHGQEDYPRLPKDLGFFGNPALQPPDA